MQLILLLKKQKQRDEAEFRMRKMAEIQELQSRIRLQLEDESAYTPDWTKMIWSFILKKNGRIILRPF